MSSSIPGVAEQLQGLGLPQLLAEMFAWIRGRFFNTGFLRSFASVALGGAISAAISAGLGEWQVDQEKHDRLGR